MSDANAKEFKIGAVRLLDQSDRPALRYGPSRSGHYGKLLKVKGDPEPHSMRATMSIDERQEKIISEFENLGDSMEKYLYLIELGRSAPALGDAYKTDENLISGGQAEVWLRGYVVEGGIHFEVDSPSLIVKGIAVLLVRVLSGEFPAAIFDAELYFIERIGLKQQLSPKRMNGVPLRFA